MNFIFLITCVFIALNYNYCNGLIEVKKLYEIYPENNVQLFKLVNELALRKEIVHWNGVEENQTSPVQVLASERDFLSFANNSLVPSGLNYGIVDPNVTINFSSLASSEHPIIDIKSIPGTSLFTGIYYKLANKRFPSGKITYTSETSEHGAKFLQIDLDPQQTQFYASGEKWYNDDQWVFIEAPDSPGWYEIRNKVLFDGITTWSYAKVGGGYHIIVSRKPEDVRHLSPGGQWRVDALWKPIRMTTTDDDGNSTTPYYKLVNKRYPNGTITWTERKYREISHYIQVDVKPEHVGNYYEPGGKWYDDALFSFTPVDVNLKAKIHSLTYDNENNWNIADYENSTMDSYDLIYTVHNPTNVTKIRNITEPFEYPMAFNFKFNSTLNSSFEEVKVKVKVPLYDEDMFQDDEQEIKLVPEEISKVVISGVVLKTKVSVPPGKGANVFAYFKWITEDFPFTAIMEISGTSDERKEVSGVVIKQQLEDELSGYEIVNEENNNNAIRIRVSGVLMGGFWYRSLVSEEAPKNLCA